MALTPKTVIIQLSQGLDTEAGELSVPVGRLTTAENVYFDRRVGMYKRPGTVSLDTRLLGPTYAQVSGAQGLATRADGADLVMLTTDGRLLSRDEPRGWLQMGPWVNVTADLEPLPVRPWEAWDGTSAVNALGTQRFVAWEDGRGGVFGQLLTTDDPPRQLSRDFRVGGTYSRQPSVVAIGNSFLCLYTSGSSLYSAPIDCINPTQPSAGQVQLTSQLSGTSLGVGPYQAYDLAPFDSITALLAINSSASLSLGFIRGDGFMAQSGTFPFRPSPITKTGGPQVVGPFIASTQDLTTVGVTSLALNFPTQLNLGLARVGVNWEIINGAGITLDTLAGPYSPYILRAIMAFNPRVAGSNGYDVQWVTECSGTVPSLTAGPTNNYLRYGHTLVDVTGNVVAQTSGTLLQHAKLASRAFQVGDDNYVWTTHESPLQSMNVLVRLSDGLQCAYSNPALAVANVSGVLPNVALLGTQAALPVSSKTEVPLPGTSGSTFTGRDLVLSVLDFDQVGTWRPVDLDGVLYMPGGMLGQYDGAGVSEVGFRLAVEGITLAGGPGVPNGGINTGSTGTGQAAFGYAVVPEWTNARGQRELGTCTAFPTTVITGSWAVGSSTVLTWPSVSHTLKDGTRNPSLTYGVYRTGPNGTVYQRVDDPARPIVNLTASVTMSWTDAAPEAFRASSEVLYSVGEPANVLPPSPSIVAAAGDRLVLAGLEGAPHDWAASKLRLGGAVSFFAGAGGSVDASGGPLTGLHGIDGNVAFLKYAKAFQAAFAGAGPSNAVGDGAPWPTTSPIVTDTGLPRNGTILEVAGESDQGLIYWSAQRGPRLLNRGLGVSNVGWQVHDLYGLNVIGGTAPYAREEARLYSTDGTTLVLNTRFDQWSTIPGQAAVGAAVWNGSPAYVDASGRVYVETTGSYRDGSRPYSMVIETGWIPVADSLLGLAKVWEIQFLGTYSSPHTLRIELAYNYRDGYTQVREFNTADALSLQPYGGDGTASGSYGSGTYSSADPRYMFRVRPNPPGQRVNAVRLRVSDRDATGQSFSLTEVKMLCGFESTKSYMGPKRTR